MSFDTSQLPANMFVVPVSFVQWSTVHNVNGNRMHILLRWSILCGVIVAHHIVLWNLV